MKKTALALFSLLFALAPLLLPAQENNHNYNVNKDKTYEHKKEKNWNKTYPAAGKTLAIANKFGDIKIVTSNGNQITVSVVIKTSSDNAEYAQSLIDQINVQESSKGNTLKLETKIEGQKNSKKQQCSNCNSSMQINYTVNVPASLELKLENSFGDIEIPDYTGNITIHQKFGKLKSGMLQNPGKVEVEFSDAQLAGANDMVGSFKFSTVNIDQLKGKNSIEFSFCEKASVDLGSGISYAEIKESYSNLNIRPASNFSAKYRIQTSFGTFINRTAIDFDRTNEPPRYGADTHQSYEGSAGGSNIQVDIHSSFGKLVLGEPKPGDMENDKSKKKGSNGNQTKTKHKQKSGQTTVI